MAPCAMIGPTLALEEASRPPQRCHTPFARRNDEPPVSQPGIRSQG